MAKNTRQKLAAILAADVVGHGRLSRVAEESTHRALGAYIGAIAALIDRRNGKVMLFAGDAVLAGAAIQ
jgi:class 3 adenylate cyclase